MLQLKKDLSKEYVLRKMRKGRALCYLSCTLARVELNYSRIEDICLALMFAIRKLMHYMQAHVVRLVYKVNPSNIFCQVQSKWGTYKIDCDLEAV